MFKKFLALLLCAMLFAAACLAETESAASATPGENACLQARSAGAEPGDEAVPESVIEAEPYVPDSLDRAIIYSDDRIEVGNPAMYPYSAIGYMIVHARCGCEWTCTGFMVGPRGLVTGSHCLCCSEHHMTADEITIYFGYQSNRNYLYLFNGSTTYWYGTDFSNTYGADPEWDYGYVLLDERVGDVTGWLGVSSLSDYDIEYKYLTVAGYRDGVLKFDSGFATVESPNVISYEADTLPGNSGCPVFYYENDDIYATAINVVENTYLNKNYGRRINNGLFDDMRCDGLFD